MIGEDLTEEEQVERLKAWLKRYGWSIIAGVGLGLIAMFSWQQWQESQIKQRQQASAVYQQFVETLPTQPEKAMEQAQVLVERYTASPYATLSQLLLAQRAVSQQQWQQAMTHLAWVEENGNDVVFKQLATIRHARLLRLEKQYDKAIALLKSVDEPAFFALAQEVTGDVLLEQGKIQEARQAYQQALAHSDDVVPAWQFVLQMKINSLPELKAPEDKA